MPILQSKPHTALCLCEGRRLHGIVCVACGIPAHSSPRQQPGPLRHHETVAHKQRVAWLKWYPAETAAWLPQQMAPQLSLPAPSATAMPRAAICCQTVQLQPGPRGAEAAAPLWIGNPAIPPVQMPPSPPVNVTLQLAAMMPSSPAAGSGGIQRLMPPSRSLDSVKPPSALRGLQSSFSDPRFEISQGLTAAAWPEVAAAWQSAPPPQRPAVPEMGMHMSELLMQGSMPHQRMEPHGTVSGSGSNDPTVSQHRFLSQLQQQGLQHKLGEAIRSMQQVTLP